jgi:hypothetical protein
MFLKERRKSLPSTHLLRVGWTFIEVVYVKIVIFSHNRSSPRSEQYPPLAYG